MAKIKFLKKKLISSSIVLLITVLFLEVLGLFIFDNRYSWEKRYLFLSQNSLVNTTTAKKKLPLWHYKPSSQIRSVATYSDFLSTKIEYDCRFKTNKLGFINTGKIKDSADYLILGDSFTEGQGGCPWLVESTITKDKYLKNFDIINAGLQSYGVAGFERILIYTKEKINIKNIVLIIISNDFKRHPPQKKEWNLSTKCYEKLKCTKEYWHFIKYNTTEKKLIETTLERRKLRANSILRELLHYSFTYRIYQDIKRFLISKTKKKNQENLLMEKRFKVNFDAIMRMNRQYNNMKIIFIPQRDEVGILGTKNKDSIKVINFFKSENLNFSVCNLNSKDYMKKDGHPNKKGYKKIFICLKNSIKESQGS